MMEGLVTSKEAEEDVPVPGSKEDGIGNINSEPTDSKDELPPTGLVENNAKTQLVDLDHKAGISESQINDPQEGIGGIHHDLPLPADPLDSDDQISRTDSKDDVDDPVQQGRTDHHENCRTRLTHSRDTNDLKDNSCQAGLTAPKDNNSQQQLVHPQNKTESVLPKPQDESDQPEQIDPTGQPEPVDSQCNDAQPRPVDSQCNDDQPGPVDSQCNDAQPRPVDSQCNDDQPGPVDSQCNDAQPEPVDSQCNDAQPGPVDSQCNDAQPEPVDSQCNDAQPGPVDSQCNDAQSEPPPPPSKPKPIKGCVKLPPHWKIAVDEDGVVYYYHGITGATQWTPPKVPPKLSTAHAPGATAVKTEVDSSRPVPAAAKVSPQGAAFFNTLGLGKNVTTDQAPVMEMRQAKRKVLSQSLEESDSEDEADVVKNPTTRPLPYKCDVCSKTFSKRKMLVSHLKKHKKQDAGNISSVAKKPRRSVAKDQFVCRHCERKFTFEKSFKKHVASCTGDKKQYKCQFCEKIFLILGSYEKHVMTHSGELEFKCTKCPQSFTSRHDFEVHMLSHVSAPSQMMDTGASDSGSGGSITGASDSVSGSSITGASDSVTGGSITGASDSVSGASVTDANEKAEILNEENTSIASTHTSIVHASNSKVKKEYVCQFCLRVFKLGASFQKHLVSHTATSPTSFRCAKCFKYFLSKNDHDVHFLTHKTEPKTEEVVSRKKEYRCEHCNMVFKHSQTKKFEKHLASHTLRSNFKCRKCDVSFKTKVELDTHVKAHVLDVRGLKKGPKPDVQTCEECGQTCIGRAAFRKHQIIHTNLLICKFCDKRFKVQDTYIRHLELHAAPKPHKCSLCNESFLVKRQIKWHKERVHNIKPRKMHKCYHCKKLFKYDRDLRYHLKMVEKPEKCSECDESFGYPPELKEHKSVVHLKITDKKEKCLICQERFVHLDALTVHKRSHDDPRKPYRCDEDACFKNFASEKLLATHKRTHTGEKPFKCPHCEKAFIDAYRLKSHEVVHQLERPIGCEHCDKRFRTKYELKSHVVIHSDTKAFTCSYCGKSFFRIGNLRLHEQTHTGEKKYECRYCGRLFRKSGVRRTHELIHTGEKPFLCKFCGKAFRHKGNWKDHETIHTGEKGYHCDICGEDFRYWSNFYTHKSTHEGGKAKIGRNLKVGGNLKAGGNRRKKPSSAASHNPEFVEEAEGGSNMSSNSMDEHSRQIPQSGDVNPWSAGRDAEFGHSGHGLHNNVGEDIWTPAMAPGQYPPDYCPPESVLSTIAPWSIAILDSGRPRQPVQFPPRF